MTPEKFDITKPESKRGITITTPPGGAMAIFGMMMGGIPSALVKVEKSKHKNEQPKAESDG